MPIYYPDILQTNNPNNAIADSDAIRGGGKVVANLAALYNISTGPGNGKYDQLKEHITRVWVTDQQKTYVLKDITQVSNADGWSIDASGTTIETTDGIESTVTDDVITLGLGNIAPDSITTSGNITAAAIIKSGGTSSQFLKADGSVDENGYVTISEKNKPDGYLGIPTPSNLFINAALSDDETKIVNVYDKNTGVPFNATKYPALPDGFSVDNVIWFTVPLALGGGYAKRDYEGYVSLLWFDNPLDAFLYGLQAEEFLDLQGETVTLNQQITIYRATNGKIVINEDITLLLTDNSILDNIEGVDNNALSKSEFVPVNYDNVLTGWMFEANNGVNNIRIVNSRFYSENVSIGDGNYRTRGYFRVRGNKFYLDNCEFTGCRNAVRVGINNETERYNNFTIKNCNFYDVEQCINVLKTDNSIIQNCHQYNTINQRNNYCQLRGADFLCSISSNFIQAYNVSSIYPVERFHYIIDAEDVLISGFKLVGGGGSGGGLKYAGWGDAENLCKRCITENGQVTDINLEFISIYGVDGVTFRNITFEGVADRLVGANNRCYNVRFENIRSISNTHIAYLQVSANSEMAGENGLYVKDWVFNSCSLKTLGAVTEYLIGVFKNVPTSSYSTVDGITFSNTEFINNDTSAKTIYSNFPSEITVDHLYFKNCSYNGLLRVYDLTNIATINRNKSIKLGVEGNYPLTDIDLSSLTYFGVITKNIPSGNNILLLKNGSTISSKDLRKVIKAVIPASSSTVNNIILPLNRNSADTDTLYSYTVGIKVSVADKLYQFFIQFSHTNTTWFIKEVFANGSTTYAFANNAVTLDNGDKLQINQASVYGSLVYNKNQSTDDISIEIELRKILLTTDSTIAQGSLPKLTTVLPSLNQYYINEKTFYNNAGVIKPVSWNGSMWVIPGTLGLVTKFSNYTITSSDDTVLFGASSGNLIATLPAANSAFVSGSNLGQIITIKKIDATTNTVTIDANGSELIDGQPTIVLTTQYDFIALQSTGTAWVVVASNLGFYNKAESDAHLATKLNTGANSSLAGTGERAVSASSTGQPSATYQIIERRVTDADITGAISGATFNSSNNFTASIIPTNSKNIFTDQWFAVGSYKYEAVSTNVVMRIPLG